MIVRSAAAPFLDCRVELGAATARIVLAGHLDRTTASVARSVVMPALHRARCVAFDLAGLQFVDAGGLGVLVSAIRTARERSALVSVVRLRHPLLDRLNSVGLHRIIDLAA